VTTKFIGIEDWDEETWKLKEANKTQPPVETYEPCDKESELYVLQQKHQMNEGGYVDSAKR
jgi:hypothetical protein